MSAPKAGPFLFTDSTPDGGATSGDVQGVTREALETGRQASAVVDTANGRQALAAEVIDDENVEEAPTSRCSSTRWPTCRTTSS